MEVKTFISQSIWLKIGGRAMEVQIFINNQQ